jgi:hypothetical protein
VTAHLPNSTNSYRMSLVPVAGLEPAGGCGLDNLTPIRSLGGRVYQFRHTGSQGRSPRGGYTAPAESAG